MPRGSQYYVPADAVSDFYKEPPMPATPSVSLGGGVSAPVAPPPPLQYVPRTFGTQQTDFSTARGQQILMQAARKEKLLRTQNWAERQKIQDEIDAFDGAIRGGSPTPDSVGAQKAWQDGVNTQANNAATANRQTAVDVAKAQGQSRVDAAESKNDGRATITERDHYNAWMKDDAAIEEDPTAPRSKDAPPPMRRIPFEEWKKRNSIGAKPAHASQPSPEANGGSTQKGRREDTSVAPAAAIPSPLPVSVIGKSNLTAQTQQRPDGSIMPASGPAPTSVTPSRVVDADKMPNEAGQRPVTFSPRPEVQPETQPESQPATQPAATTPAPLPSRNFALQNPKDMTDDQIYRALNGEMNPALIKKYGGDDAIAAEAAKRGGPKQGGSMTMVDANGNRATSITNPSGSEATTYQDSIGRTVDRPRFDALRQNTMDRLAAKRESDLMAKNVNDMTADEYNQYLKVRMRRGDMRSATEQRSDRRTDILNGNTFVTDTNTGVSIPVGQEDSYRSAASVMTDTAPQQQNYAARVAETRQTREAAVDAQRRTAELEAQQRASQPLPSIDQMRQGLLNRTSLPQNAPMPLPVASQSATPVVSTVPLPPNSTNAMTPAVQPQSTQVGRQFMRQATATPRLLNPTPTVPSMYATPAAQPPVGGGGTPSKYTDGAEKIVAPGGAVPPGRYRRVNGTWVRVG
jgi:hypothetical protein